MKYSLLNYFPYELNYESKFVDNFLGNFAFGFASLTSLFFYATFNTSHSNGFSFVIMIAGIFASVMIFVNLFIPLKYLKLHIFTSTFTSIMNILLAAGTVALNVDEFKISNKPINLIAAIIAGLIALYLLVLILNPNYSLRIKGVEKKEENGQVTYVRPKLILMAFAEWNMMFVPFATAIPLMMYLIII